MKGKTLRQLLAASLCLLAVVPQARSADIHANWTGNGDGITWEDAANWSSASYPNNGGGDIYHPWVENGLGPLLLETYGTITTRGLTLTQSVGGSTTLKLGGDFELVSGVFANGSGIFNADSNPANVVIDLNGYNFINGVNVTQHNFHTAAYTVKSSATDGSGVYNLRNFESGANIHVQNNVTVRLSVTAAINHLSGTTWSAGSTLQAAAMGTHTASASSQVLLGNVLVGSSGNTAATTLSVNNSSLTVRGNLQLLSFTGATGGAASKLSFSASGLSLRVGGNFIDAGTDASNYGANANVTGTLILVGGAAGEKTLSSGRTGLNNHFRIGDALEAGNVVLGQDLKTTGDVLVQADSRFNVASHTLSTGEFVVEDGATLALGQEGLFKSLGGLTLNLFELELVGDWSNWNDGDDLVLFEYDDLLTGTPLIHFTTTPPGFTYDALVVDHGSIYLSNVVIPEPGVWALSGIALCLLGVAGRMGRFRKHAVIG